MYKLPFWEVPSHGKARGVLKDGVFLPMFPESASVASRYVADLKPAPQV